MDKLTLQGQDFTWKGPKGSSTLGRLGLTELPRDGFNIISHRSGEIRFFAVDQDKMEAMEFYDGEACAYRCGKFWVEVWVGETI